MTNRKEFARRYVAPTLSGALAAAGAASPLLTVTVFCLGFSVACLNISLRSGRRSRLIQSHHG